MEGFSDISANNCPLYSSPIFALSTRAKALVFLPFDYRKVGKDQFATSIDISVYRSLYHHFECATYMYKTACIPEIEQDFQATLLQCREVTEERIKNETAFYKIVGGLMKFIAPLM